MICKNKFARVTSAAVLSAALIAQVSDLYAWGPGPREARPRGREPQPKRSSYHHNYYTPHYMSCGREMSELPRGYLRVIIAGLEYFYWEGMFYRMMANRYVVVPAPVGAVVTAIPQGPQPVIVDGVPYYNINGVTYMFTPSGYKVVPQPKTIIIKNYNNNPIIASQAVAPQVPAATSIGAQDQFTVNIPNA
ncbi:MAG TPA: DUF6515 family protein, partial [Candidatus Omnitrophota bacterium]|nr:DUF6515 family protein [Candidatus Omnitrophota bacterium]